MLKMKNPLLSCKAIMIQVQVAESQLVLSLLVLMSHLICLFVLMFFLSSAYRSFGGEVAWEGEGSPYSESDEAITHQIVDRPTQGHKFLSRSYVQPQWVVDSANHRVLMPLDLYQPGKAPPPHLSPFVDYQQEGYTPDFAVTVQKLQVGFFCGGGGGQGEGACGLMV